MSSVSPPPEGVPRLNVSYRELEEIARTLAERKVKAKVQPKKDDEKRQGTSRFVAL